MRGDVEGGLQTALIVIVVALTLANPAAQDLAAIPRTSDGKPDVSGIWQTLGAADYDLEPHAARTTADPRNKCFTLGTPRGIYGGEPFQIFQRPRDLTVVYPTSPGLFVSMELFEDRYGAGAQERLLALLQQPCVTFAEIADQFGVTRECVRQWHQRLLPGAPTGHERQRLCRQYQRKRELFKDTLFAGFYRRFRAQVPSRRIGLIPARDGFRRRTVRLDRHVVALKRARASAAPVAAASYRLVNGIGDADFVYYELNDRDYLFLPRPVLTDGSTTFVDADGTAYQQFKNTFGALWRWPAE